MKHQLSPQALKWIFKVFRRLLPVLFFLFGLIPTVFADVNTLTWAHNLKGYSIEQIPGSTEFVAAGTVYDPMYAGYNGTHFLRLDANGNVLFSRIMWNAVGYNNNYESWNVIDIAVEDVDKYWITYQVRGKWAGQEKDYIHANRVDGNGNSAFSPPLYNWYMHYSANGDTRQQNLYPTHTLWYDHALYICGYAAANTEYPNVPHHAYSDKAGFILKYDDITGNITPYFWNTGGGETDFDMALRMRLTSNGQIMLTGAMNIVPGCPSGILVMLYDKNIVLQKWNGVITGYYVCYSDPYFDFGYYGMDMWEDGTAEKGYYVLANYEFQGNISTWGVLHVRNDLTVDPAVNTYMAYQPHNHSFWGNQVFHGPNGSITVVGQETTLECPGTLPPPNLQPSVMNVNPFMMNCNWFWGAGGISNTFNWYKMQPSVLGTQAGGKDYFSGNLIEDVTRLYTFTAQQDNDPNGDLVMINPITDPSGTNLNIKFTRVDAGGNENVCGNTHDDCDPDFAAWPSWNIGAFTSDFVEGTNVPYPVYYGNFYDPLPTTYDCTTGVYKTGEAYGIKAFAGQYGTMANNGRTIDKKAAAFTCSIYPNPVKDKINVSFNSPVSEFRNLSISMKDVMGRVVFRQEHISGEGYGISLKLPPLPPGVYIATVNNGETETAAKIVVQ